ncbi:MAG: FAD-dependent oxidoreductase [Sulfuricella sp.]|nr:FAD-dependent oxidoreductase [Sulfuricella sp.]
MRPIVILGSGLAGVSLARELRKLDKEIPLVLVTADDGAFYSKPNLSNALGAGKSPAQLALTPAPQLAEQLHARILAHTTVSAIHAVQRRIDTSGGPLEYSKLVLAIGAQPIRPALDGDAAADVLTVNSLADYTRFRERLAGKRRIAILGGGLIGCEFANDLCLGGFAATIFDRAKQPLGRLLPPQAGQFLRARLEQGGVTYHPETSLIRVERHNGGYHLSDDHGAEHQADLVLSAVGLQPAVELARTAGLTVRRGIVVGRGLASSDPHIYALGDCAEIGGLVLSYVLPIMQAARALAQTLAGTPVEVSYPAMPVVVKTPACPTVVCPPPAAATGIWHEESGSAGVRSIFADDTGKALGFALLGEETTKEKVTLAGQMPGWL